MKFLCETKVAIFAAINIRACVNLFNCCFFFFHIRLVPIINCGQILIVHLSKYPDSGNNVFIKNTDFVECLPETTHVLRVPIQTGDSILFTNQYSLIATINHSGTLQAGHYWAFIKDHSTNNWLKRNHRTVLKVKQATHTLNNTSYVLQKLIFISLFFARGLTTGLIFVGWRPRL